jgi:hypothetical protein
MNAVVVVVAVSVDGPMEIEVVKHKNRNVNDFVVEEELCCGGLDALETSLPLLQLLVQQLKRERNCNRGIERET